MHPIRLAVLALAAALAAAPTLAEDGVRHLPARDVPVPDTVSPAMAALIRAPLQPTWNEHPKSAQEWKAPPVTPVAPVSPTTATGVGLGVSGGLLIVPPPSWP